MGKHYELSDSEFKEQFANCTLDSTLFSHEAHLRLAWLLINEFGLEKAEVQIQEQLKNFVANVGAKDKYHVTITLVAIKMVHHFMQKSKTESFADFILENPQLKTNFKGLIRSHYSFDVFDNIKAGRQFIDPDILPF